MALAKLLVNPTSSNRREIALGRTLLSIGRDPSNDLVLPDAMVSRRHAVIEFRGSQYYLRDCNSSNGSVINGDRVSEKSLRDGDVVAIGSARLLFREEVELDLAGKVVQHPSSPRLACPACEAPYRKGDLFCRGCGAKLPEPSGPPKEVCAECGTAVLLPAHFCNACGAKLPEAIAPPQATEAPDVPVAGKSGEGALPPSAIALPLAAPVPMASPRTSTGLRSQASLVHAATPPPGPPRAPVGAQKVEASRELEVKRPVSSSSERTETASAAPADPRPAPPAPAGLRALAAAVDLVLLAAAEALVLVPLFSYWSSRELSWGAAEVAFLPILLSLLAVPLCLFLGAGYFVWSWGVLGGTAGQRMLDLAVEGEDGRFPIGLARGAVRLFGYLLSVLSLGVGFLLVPLTGFGLHDRIAGTRVVSRRAGARSD